MDYDSELILQYIDSYLQEHYCIICEPDFEDILIDDIKYMLGVYPDNIYWEDMTEPLLECVYLYYVYFMPRRSFDTTFICNSKPLPELTLQIDQIKQKSQTTQKTDEWYHMRHNLITASNLYKIFDSVCVQNELIYEKCKPYVNSNMNIHTNTESSLNWGNKYEPVSIMIYEEIFSTQIDNIGCITHDHYSFLGASPDGINVNPNSQRYGRLLEIKNVKSREIDGTVSKPYWVQTQLQMEVCNLNECDFLETKFTEYENYNAFVKDNFEDDDGDNNKKNVGQIYTNNKIDYAESVESVEDVDEDNLSVNTNNTSSNECKYRYSGVILYFHKPSEPPCYVYKPLHIKTLDDIQTWEEKIIQEYETKGYQWITNYYWKLVVFNCVLILRNPFWFNSSIKDIIKFWDLIQEERITGYSHRAPASKKNKVSISISSPIIEAPK